MVGAPRAGSQCGAPTMQHTTVQNAEKGGTP